MLYTKIIPNRVTLPNMVLQEAIKEEKECNYLKCFIIAPPTLYKSSRISTIRINVQYYTLPVTIASLFTNLLLAMARDILN